MITTDNLKQEKPDRVPERFRLITYHAVTAGLCLLIPFPFVDDWAMRLARRSMLRSLWPGLLPGKKQINALANGPSDWRRGCLMLPIVVVRKLILWPLKRFLRKLLIVFAIKDCVTEMSRTFQVGYLFDLASQRPDVELPESGASGLESALRLHEAMKAAMEQVDARPVRRLLWQVLLHSRSLLRGAAGTVRRLLRRGRRKETLNPDEAPSGALQDIWNEVTQLLWHEDEFLAELDRAFDAIWRNSPAESNKSAVGASQSMKT